MYAAFNKVFYIFNLYFILFNQLNIDIYILDSNNYINTINLALKI